MAIALVFIWQFPQLKHYLNPRLHFQIQPQRALGSRTFKAQALRKDTSRHNQDPRYTTNKLETRLV